MRTGGEEWTEGASLKPGSIPVLKSCIEDVTCHNIVFKGKHKKDKKIVDEQTRLLLVWLLVVSADVTGLSL